MDKKLIEIFIRDLQKPEIDQFNRAEILRQYLKQEGLSQREFGKRFGIPQPTVYNWLVWNRITENDYQRLTKKGVKHSTIFQQLRNTKQDLKIVMELEAIDHDIEDMNNKIKHYIRADIKISTQTETKLLELRDAINRLLMKIERLTNGRN